jgi:hypothetical protein
MLDRTLLGRLGQPEEVANVALVVEAEHRQDLGRRVPLDLVDGAGLDGGTPAQPGTRDAVPVGEVNVRRGEPVHAADGDIGRVQGIVIDPGSRHVTHVLLPEGHLWGPKEVAIPVSAVASTSDGIRLNIARQQVQDLPPAGIDHPDLSPAGLTRDAMDAVMTGRRPLCMPDGGNGRTNLISGRMNSRDGPFWRGILKLLSRTGRGFTIPSTCLTESAAAPGRSPGEVTQFSRQAALPPQPRCYNLAITG